MDMVRAMLCAVLVPVLCGVPGAQEVTIDVKGAQQDGTAPVTLKFDNAPLKRVIKELCDQIGWLVSAAQGFWLRPGPSDPRPRCIVDGCEFFVDEIDIRAKGSQKLDLRAARGAGLGGGREPAGAPEV